MPDIDSHKHTTNDTAGDVEVDSVEISISAAVNNGTNTTTTNTGTAAVNATTIYVSNKIFGIKISDDYNHFDIITLNAPRVIYYDLLVSFLLTFLSISILGIIDQYYLFVTEFNAVEVAILTGSYGALSVLLFFEPHSPLAQPRNVFFGYLISSTIGKTHISTYVTV